MKCKICGKSISEEDMKILARPNSNLKVRMHESCYKKLHAFFTTGTIDKTIGNKKMLKGMKKLNKKVRS